MERLISLLLIVSSLIVPSFVNSEGVDTMANGYRGTFGLSNTYEKPKPKNPYEIKGTIGIDAISATQSPSSTTSINSIPAIDYEALLEANMRVKREALQKQRDSSLASLDIEQSNLTNDMYDKRNRAGAQSDIGKMNFAQFMASRGVAGNAGAMPEIYANNALQSQIGALNQQEAMGNAQIQANRTSVNNAYQKDLSAAKNQMEADLLQATIDQQNADKVAALEQQRYNTQLKTSADVTAYNRLQDTKSDYANTVGQFSGDYQAEINKVQNDGDPSNDWQISILAAARQQKLRELDEIKAAQATAAAKAEQQKFENDLKTKQLELDTKRTNYTISRPYSNGDSKTLTPLQQQNNTNNSKIAQMTNWIYNVPTNTEALSRLTQNKAMILQQLQEAGYDGSQALQYYNDMYTDLVGN